MAYSVQSYENECGWHSLVKSDEKFLSSYWDLSLLIDYLMFSETPDVIHVRLLGSVSLDNVENQKT